jgi:hypothetical protein
MAIRAPPAGFCQGLCRSIAQLFFIFDLPKVRDVVSANEAFSTILANAAAGFMSPAEAGQMATVLKGRLDSALARETAEKVSMIERQLAGRAQ